MPYPEPDAPDATALWASAQVTALAANIKDWTVPEYGCTEWLQLSADDPRRAAAIIEAAEQWRRHVTEQARLDRLAEDDPDRWFAEVTADADAYACKIAGTLARTPTVAELNARRVDTGRIREQKATPGWPPIRIPGGGGRCLTYEGDTEAAA
ncbi:hypothetical protein [Streptomyces sp. XH2]|uniref:hypothetical protein n=1 Tax=Streptomyces sp. XH2 TaxID=3412483 RepID=UPI003C7AA7DE